VNETPTADDGHALDEILTQAWREIEHDHLLPMQVTAWRTGRGELYEARVLPGPWATPGHDGVAAVSLDRRCLAEGPKVVLGTLLHAAVHVILGGNFLAGKRAARYHTEQFRDTADLVGLKRDFEDDGRGWAATQPTKEALARHHATLAMLEQVLATYQPDTDRPRRASGSRLIPMACACPIPRRIWTFASTAAGPAFRCDACGAPLTAPAD
jgi:hypothetical protein